MVKCISRGAELGSDITIFNVTLMKPQFFRKFNLNKGHSVYKVGEKTHLLIFITQFSSSKAHCCMLDRLYKWMFLLNKYQRKLRCLFRGCLVVLFRGVRVCEQLIQQPPRRTWVAVCSLWPESSNRRMCHGIKQKKNTFQRGDSHIKEHKNNGK